MRIFSGKRARSSAISSGPSITWASLSTTRVSMGTPPLSAAAGQAEGLLGEQVAQHLRGARRDGDRARVEIGLRAAAPARRAGIVPELCVGTRERQHELRRALLDLAPEELLERDPAARGGAHAGAHGSLRTARARSPRAGPGQLRGGLSLLALGHHLVGHLGGAAQPARRAGPRPAPRQLT